jgi:hypothetical protein
MTDQHPITPPPELVEKWYDAIDDLSSSWKQQLATCAAQWGADVELEKCCELLWQFGFNETLPRLQRIRRPKPPSLKKQALNQLDAIQLDLNRANIYGANNVFVKTDTIRKALESIND